MTEIRIEVIEVIEHDDGSATFVWTMDEHALSILASIGLERVLTEEAQRITASATEPEGSRRDSGSIEDEGRGPLKAGTP